MGRRYVFIETNKQNNKQITEINKIMKTLTFVESAQYELDQLDFWFKMNKGQQGTDEWNENIERGIELCETVKGL